ncbi:hypothetical protein [Streptomyces sp. ML-6]|uniref:hypothetical protein n=1 Tax=Streptomyces sp. ML-6 TaxID=2982693 RepID=UPI0024C0309F|nr:hypothetical protein [Streptomyces sp. ML-6]MDK0525020.1 hypothetical protein [Streptomyces sp. ML-6]
MTILNAAFSYVEYATAEEIGEDSITWMADLLGLPEWPADRDFAIVCVTTVDGPAGYLTEDIDYARMLEEAHGKGIPLTLSDEITQKKFPINRPGWPGTWLGFDAATEQ